MIQAAPGAEATDQARLVFPNRAAARGHLRSVPRAHVDTLHTRAVLAPPLAGATSASAAAASAAAASAATAAPVGGRLEQALRGLAAAFAAALGPSGELALWAATPRGVVACLARLSWGWGWGWGWGWA